MHLIDLQFMGRPNMIGIYLLETNEGPVLFECGPHSCLPTLVKALDNLGYNTSDIKHLFLTHIHLDHAGAAWHFAAQGTTIYVHPKGLKHLIDPSRLVDSATKIYGAQMQMLWGDFMPTPPSSIITAAHNQVFEIGGESIKTLHSPGHAVHHIAWNTSAGTVCGDVAGIRLLNGPAVPPCPPPDVNFVDWKKSIDILLAENTSTLFVAHFGKYENGIDHLKQLKHEIEVWDEFAFELYSRNPDPKSALAEFDSWIEKRMIHLTSNAELAQLYAIANPSWMSVHGIFRYYRKREELCG